MNIDIIECSDEAEAETLSGVLDAVVIGELKVKAVSFKGKLVVIATEGSQEENGA